MEIDESRSLFCREIINALSMRLDKNTAISFVRDVPNARFVLVGLIINFVVVLFVTFAREKLPLLVPLWYGAPAGETQLADRMTLVIPPFIASGVVFFGAIIAKFINDSFLQSVVVGVGVLCTILSTIAVFKIILLVGGLL